MSETEETVAVSDKEIAAVEAEVAKKAADEQTAKAAEVEARVRKELAAEQKLKELEAKMASQASEVESAKAEAARAKAEAEAMIKAQVEARLAQELATSKRVVNNQNPFQERAPANPVEGLSPDKIAEIERQSYLAFKNRGREDFEP